ncbi:carbon-nitrogen hydrolase family protein [candidate division WOR-3 bacterium]|nr:carbon-nitrogen hydrolase family protein [candidate division WOR-3 bacterium]
MKPLKIALFQLTSHGFNQKANEEKGLRYCRKASELGVDIALFPEMWNIGYTPFDPKDPRYQEAIKEWQERAINQESDFFLSYRKLAKELNMAIALTYLEKWSAAPRDTVSLIDRHGKVVLTYAKVHTCDFSLDAALTSGNDFYVCILDTEKGPVKIGAMICYDREFPESARILMLKGAEIILTPNACRMEQNRLTQFRARAFENMVGLALANYAGSHDGGHSVAYSPIAFDKKGNSSNNLLIEAGENEGIYMAHFNLTELREYRKKETWGNSYRKPGCYKEIISTEVQEPFIRKDVRR